MRNTRLVWSDDPKDKVETTSATPPTSAANWVAVFRIEKGGRGGKTVTVLDQLPKHETFLRELCRELKSKCGSGGTYSLTGDCGQIEIQGDKRVAMKAILEKKGIRFKGM